VYLRPHVRAHCTATPAVRSSQIDQDHGKLHNVVYYEWAAATLQLDWLKLLGCRRSKELQAINQPRSRNINRRLGFGADYFCRI